jgi:hypothetical protein
MQEHPFTLAGAALVARAGGALWWPARRLICVSDLHLGKSGRIARGGGPLLPPYEVAETLDRLEAEMAALAPRAVVCLGDSFDDAAASGELDPAAQARLTVLMAGRRWIWVTGNHDPGPVALPGETRAEFALGGLTFRHAARPGAAAEISGHWHPKTAVTLRGRRVSRPAFLIDGRRAILPAFGAYTGGLPVTHPELAGLMGPEARAVLTGRVMLPVPLGGAAAAARTG